jgi:hypothetical protein
MLVEKFAAPKRARSSSEEENSEKGKPPIKRKETPKEVTKGSSDEGESTGPEMDDYMITVETWKELPTDLKDMIKNQIAKGDHTQKMAFRRKGMNITVSTPQDFEREEASQLTEMIERRSKRGAFPREKRTL